MPELSALPVTQCTQSGYRPSRLTTADEAELEFLEARPAATTHRRLVRLLRRHFDRAEKLLLQHSLTKRLRTLDSIHLAVALDLRDTGLVDSFVTADGLLVTLARAEGMTVVNPSEP